MSDLLRVADLRVLFPGRHGEETAPVDGVSLAVGVGETVAVVGESGSGKTLTALAVIGLVPPPGRIGGGSRILFEGTDLTSAGQETRRGVRGGRIGMVLQNA
ncbi:MAG: ATP-binding cassette domain-containing protein, partial [Gemmatimonadales bacterium]|nr:ATP-binding cassette domain-containing protein [Gemmatimonadales bacterium]